MDCQAAVELLIVGLEREFSVEEGASLAEHLASCDPCRSVRQRLGRRRSGAGIDSVEREKLLGEARARSRVRVVPLERVGVQADEIEAPVRPSDETVISDSEDTHRMRPVSRTRPRRLDDVVDPTRPEPEAAIPGFEIIDVVGSGAMGTVYKARQLSMDRVVALKVLSREMAADAEFIERFLREARVSGRLNHLNVVGIFDTGQYGQTYYLAMEYVEGRSAKEMLKERVRFPERQAVDICLQIGRALEHASRYDLVHRDVKPDNILVTPRGVAKLCDLGLSKARTGDAALTQDGVVVGTPFYIAPEQAQGSLDLDVRADIYSLGCTLYHMLTGCVPFEGKTSAVVMKQHLKDPFPDPREIVPDISSGLVSILRRMVEKDRENRYALAEDLCEDLEALLKGRFTEKPRPPAVRARPRRDAPMRRKPTTVMKRIRGPRPPRRSYGAVLTILVTLLCVAGVAVLFTLTQKRRAADAPSGQAETARPDSGAETPAETVETAPDPESDARRAETRTAVERIGRRFREDPLLRTSQGAEALLRELDKRAAGLRESELAEEAAALRAEIVAVVREQRKQREQREEEAAKFLARAWAKAEKLVQTEQFGEALRDGGPLDLKLAPPRSRAEMLKIRSRAYAKARSCLQRRIEQSRDPAHEFVLITRGMPKSVVDEARKRLGVKGRAR